MKTNTIPEYKFAQSVEEVVKKYGIKRVIKLSSNESPLGVSPNVIREIKKWAKSVHLYP
ncbi:MAG: histidinol-phosphate transaminase, partial [Thermoplasmata archaeon]